jgi:hypothetical protein
MPNSGEAFPLTNDEVRRRRLEQLALAQADDERVDTGLKLIAATADVSAANLDHIIKRRKQAKRDDGSQPLVSMGDALARKIEAAMGLMPGWLDWPFLNVPYEAVAKLGLTGRTLLEGAMTAALRDMEKQDVVRRVDKKAVSNATVEKHFPELDKEKAHEAHAKAAKSSAARVLPGPKLRQQRLFNEGESNE